MQTFVGCRLPISTIERGLFIKCYFAPDVRAKNALCRVFSDYLPPSMPTARILTSTPVLASDEYCFNCHDSV